jgi:hypothetical protein
LASEIAVDENNSMQNEITEQPGEETTETSDTTNIDKEADTSKDDNNEVIKDEIFDSAKASTGGKFDTLTLIQDVAKYEAKIENIRSNSIDESVFYKNLPKFLSDEDMQLRFEDDQSKYIDAINNAKNKWLQENSIDTSKEEEALAAAQGNLVIAKAIDSVLKDNEYKDFNFIKLQDFYTNDLTKKEQMELDKGSTKEKLADYFKKIHNEYKKRNPKNVKNIEAPNIPDASKTSKTSVEDKKEIEKENDKKRYMEKIGFRKL